MAGKKQKSAQTAEAAVVAQNKADAMYELEAKDSPVLVVITKRLRAAKKKLKRVEEIEIIKATGKDINADQEEVLRGKAKVLANIEELQKLAPLLKDAVQEEIANLPATEQAPASVVDTPVQTDPAPEPESLDVDEAKEASEDAGANLEEGIMRLLQLLYFAQVFSAKGAYREAEIKACLSLSNRSSEGEGLTVDDLHLIADFGTVLLSRPLGLSHKQALEQSKDMALKWIHGASTPLPAILGSSVSVADLVRRFERIVGMDSGYYKAADVAALTPSAVEQAAAANASAGRAPPRPHLANGYAQGMQYMEVDAPSAPEPVMAEATGSGPQDPPAMQPELQFTDAQFSGYTPAYHSETSSYALQPGGVEELLNTPAPGAYHANPDEISNQPPPAPVEPLEPQEAQPLPQQSAPMDEAGTNGAQQPGPRGYGQSRGRGFFPSGSRGRGRGGRGQGRERGERERDGEGGGFRGGRGREGGEAHRAGRFRGRGRGGRGGPRPGSSGDLGAQSQAAPVAAY